MAQFGSFGLVSDSNGASPSSKARLDTSVSLGDVLGRRRPRS